MKNKKIFRTFAALCTCLVLMGGFSVTAFAQGADPAPTATPAADATNDSNVVVEEILLSELQRITAFAREHEDEFLEMVTKKSLAELNKSQREGKRELEQAMQRISKLDKIIQRLYEDNVEGKISDERFAKMSSNYEAEQEQLEARINELKDLLSAEKEESLNASHFLDLVRRYTDIRELDAEIIREFVEKIYVYKAERVDGHRVQRIKIIWNCIGEFNTPANEKSA